MIIFLLVPTMVASLKEHNFSRFIKLAKIFSQERIFYFSEGLMLLQLVSLNQL